MATKGVEVGIAKGVGTAWEELQVLALFEEELVISAVSAHYFHPFHPPTDSTGNLKPKNQNVNNYHQTKHDKVKSIFKLKGSEKQHKLKK